MRITLACVRQWIRNQAYSYMYTHHLAHITLDPFGASTMATGIELPFALVVHVCDGGGHSRHVDLVALRVHSEA
jgi:hypothetical protein